MDTLIAIATLCHLSGFDLSKIKKEQDRCQKELIECYEKNHPKGATPWEGVLKDCRLAQLKLGEE